MGHELEKNAGDLRRENHGGFEIHVARQNRLSETRKASSSQTTWNLVNMERFVFALEDKWETIQRL